MQHGEDVNKSPQRITIERHVQKLRREFTGASEPLSCTNERKFPIGCIPSTLGTFAKELSIYLQVPDSIVAALCVAAVSTAAAKKYVVNPKADWIEAINVFILGLLPSGDRKSATIKHVLAPIVAYQNDERLRIEPIRREARAKLEAIEQRKKQLLDKAGKSDDSRREYHARLVQLDKERDETFVPSMPQYLAMNVTPEKLVALLKEQGERMGLFTAEPFELFSLIGGRYSSGKPNYEIFLQAYSGDYHVTDRTTRESITLSSPALTLGLFGQPAVLKELAGLHRAHDLGFLARFAILAPSSLVGHRNMNPPPISSSVKDAYHDLLTFILGQPLPNDPSVLTFNSEARKNHLTFCERIEARLAPGHGDLQYVREFASKLGGLVARLAALLHIADAASNRRLPSDEIPVSAVTAAIKLGEFLLEEYCCALFDAGLDTPVSKSEQVLGFIRRSRKRYFSRAEAFRSLRRGGFAKAEDLNAPLAHLVDHNCLKCFDGRDLGMSSSGAKFGAVYVVNPDIVALGKGDLEDNHVDQVYQISQRGPSTEGGKPC